MINFYCPVNHNLNTIGFLTFSQAAFSLARSNVEDGAAAVPPLMSPAPLEVPIAINWGAILVANLTLY